MILSVSSWPLSLQGKVEEAQAFVRKAHELDPRFYLAYWFEGLSWNMKGEPAQAAKALETGLGYASSNRWLESALGYSLAKAGQTAGARRVLADLERRSKTQYVSAYGMAQIHLALGETDAALELLERALRSHDSYQFYLTVDPYFLPLHGNPRYQALVARVRAGGNGAAQP